MSSWKWEEYQHGFVKRIALEEDGAAIATIDVWSSGCITTLLWKVQTGRKEVLRDFPVGTPIESVKSFMETMARMEGWDG